MKTCFLRAFALIVICVAALTASATSGVYLTYDDFKNGKIQKADDGTFQYHYNNRNITFTQGSAKQKFAAKSIWGFLLNDELFRMIPSPQNIPLPCKLTSAGKYCIWYYSESYMASGAGGSSEHTIDVTYLCYGINGQPFLMWHDKQLEKAVAAVKELKPVFDCAKGQKSSMMNTYLSIITECIKTLPGYVADTKSVVPAIKN